ncbi:hypothetical protein K1719_014810 [Acacia pycnantha]|nr:hypothetical protein K1719_014810 [Acacia pycnantha]
MRSDSDIWNNLARLWPKVAGNIRWEVGNGMGVKFETDIWLEDGKKLIDKCTRQPAEGEEGLLMEEEAVSSLLSAIFLLLKKFVQDRFGKVPLSWGITADGYVAFSDDAELLKGACGKSLASFPQGCFYSTAIGGLRSFENPKNNFYISVWNMDNSDGSHSDGGEPVGKRVRGSTKMGDLVARHEKQQEKLHVDFDANKNPIGDQEDKFTSYVGYLARSKVHIV